MGLHIRPLDIAEVVEQAIIDGRRTDARGKDSVG